MFSTATRSTFTRKKTIESVMNEVNDDSDGPKLKRCLSRFDIVAYGISTTVGFVLAFACLLMGAELDSLSSLVGGACVGLING